MDKRSARVRALLQNRKAAAPAGRQTTEKPGNAANAGNFGAKGLFVLGQVRPCVWGM